MVGISIDDFLWEQRLLSIASSFGIGQKALPHARGAAQLALQHQAELAGSGGELVGWAPVGNDHDVVLILHTASLWGHRAIPIWVRSVGAHPESSGPTTAACELETDKLTACCPTIKTDFRAGTKSIRLIVREHDLSEATVRKREAEGWTRDLFAAIQVKAAELVRNAAVRTELRNANWIAWSSDRHSSPRHVRLPA